MHDARKRVSMSRRPQAEVLDMVFDRWIQGCEYEQWMMLMAFACETENQPLVMKLLFAGYNRESRGAFNLEPPGRTEQPKAAGFAHSTAADASEAARYANRAVGKARTLYQMLSRRYALDAEQRHKGAAGLTEAERVQLEMRIKDARVRLAQLGEPPPTVM